MDSRGEEGYNHRMMDMDLYFLLITAYGLLGLFVGGLYYFCPRLREEPMVHFFTGLVIVLAVILVVTGTAVMGPTSRTTGLGTAIAEAPAGRGIGSFHSSLQFFLFLGSSLCYVPVVVFLLLQYWHALLEKITSAASRSERAQESKSQTVDWERVQAQLEALAADPHNVLAHERLGDLYARMGFYESAVYEYRKAADWLGRGYAQGHMLYKAAHILVERKKDIPSALLLLRRIVRLYPKSYFASYARRIINHYEAHAGETLSDI